LAELCEALSATRKRGEMVALVGEFLTQLRPQEIEPAVCMLLGRAFPRWSSKTLEIGWITLQGLILELSRAKPEDFLKEFDKTGDLGAATRALFEECHSKYVMLVEKPLELLEVSETLEKIASATGAGARERKLRLLQGLLARATPLEAKYLIKIIIGEMRTGFQDGMMELVTSRAFGFSSELIHRAAMFAGDVATVVKIASQRGEAGLRGLKPQVFVPVQPMLAQSVNDVAEALAAHGGESAFEYKFDGARVQVHKLGEEVRIFSRRLSDITESLPDIVSLARSLRAGEAILEGEVVALGARNKPLPFQHLMRRFRRELEIERMVEEVPVGLYLFDAILVDGISLVDSLYRERRVRLAQVAGEVPLTEQLVTPDEGEARRFVERALRDGHEGVMAKQLNGPYIPGIRGKLWLKIKPVLEPLDLVIVAAEYGYGRRHAWLSDYYLAARDEETGEFLVVGKTFKGLSDREIVEMTEKLKELAVKQEGRRVIVRPHIVVEVACNEIQRSPKYPCGVALRFARITRIREDKGPENADTLQRVMEIYRGQVKRRG